MTKNSIEYDFTELPYAPQMSVTPAGYTVHVTAYPAGTRGPLTYSEHIDALQQAARDFEDEMDRLLLDPASPEPAAVPGSGDSSPAGLRTMPYPKATA